MFPSCGHFTLGSQKNNYSYLTEKNSVLNLGFNVTLKELLFLALSSGKCPFYAVYNLQLLRLEAAFGGSQTWPG